MPGMRLFTSGNMTSSRCRLNSPKQYSKMFFDLPGFLRVSKPALCTHNQVLELMRVCI